MLRITSITTIFLFVALCSVNASPHFQIQEPVSATLDLPSMVYKQTIEYVYTTSTITETDIPLISAIITNFDREGNVTAIELKDRETLTLTERLLEDLSREIIMGNMEKEIVSIRYELNMVGDPVSADIMYFDLGELGGELSAEGE